MHNQEHPLRLNKAFSDWATDGGIFSALANLSEVDLPWDTAASDLDLDYHGGWSGYKIVSPLVDSLADEDTGELSAAARAKLAAVIWARYGDAWTKICEALATEYAPLENYNMVESGSESGGETRRPDLETETTNQSETTTTENGVYGFNSAEAVPSDTSTATLTGGRKTTEKGSDTTTKNSSHELSRSGNIGVTTSQQMLQSEIDLRRNAIYLDMIYRDIDKILTIPIY